jgi:hypothetical protein
MLESLRTSLTAWNESTSDRRKLQQLYLLAIVVTVLTAGVFALIDYRIGHDILRIAGILVGVFLINTVAWSLLQSIILSRIPAKPVRPARARR